VFVCKLRKKLVQATGGEHYIETIWGRGYQLRDPDPVRAAAASLPVSEARAA
jgi:two-component system cell cycle response regulator CtrA